MTTDLENESGSIPLVKIKEEKIDEEVERKLDPNYVPPPHEEDDKKNVEPLKSSNEILAELFLVFNAAPPEELLNDENLIEISKKRKKEKKSKKKKRKRDKSNDRESNESENLEEGSSKKKRKRSKSKDSEKSDTSKKKRKRSKSKDKEKNKDDADCKEKKEKKKRSKSKDRSSKKKLKKSKDRDEEKSSLSPKIKIEKIEDSSKDKVLEDDEITRSIKKTEALSDVSISDEETYLKERKSYSYRQSRYSYERERERSSNNRRERVSIRSRSRKYSPPRRPYDRDRRRRSRSRSQNDLGIDKKRLLEIARKNAIAMFKNGSLPGCSGMTDEVKDKVLLKMRYGGKSVQDLTDFCRKLTTGNNLDNLSDFSSDGDSDHDKDGNAKAFHHPFAIKEREPIVLNIKNSISIPPKTAEQNKTQAIQMFPVSSGQDHRRTEQWVPVSPKREVIPKPTLPIVPVKHIIPVAKNAFDKPLPQEEKQEPAFKIPGKEDEKKDETEVVSKEEEVPVKDAAPSVFPQATQQNVDVSSIISMRLNAMRRLQENPMDSEAIKMIYNCQQDMTSWVNSKNTPGKFTGSTGVSVLSARQLSGDYDVWAKKDQLKNTAPVSGGMGMHLLQKMGWKPGEGLGREKNGQVQPLLLDIKMDKKGLAAEYAEPKARNTFASKKKKGKSAVPIEGTYNAQQMQNKHPVSLLNELAAKRKWAQPTYVEVNIPGPGHQKSFLFNVQLNGQLYVSKRGASTKKDAKMYAAKNCLQQIGVLPVDP